MNDTSRNPLRFSSEIDLRGTNQTGMRAQNERLVLTLIRRHGALAKADIARLTGLSAQTVSVIMRGLEQDGLLLKGDPIRGRVGQPSVPMRLRPEGAFFLGLKVGRRSTEIVLTDFLGQIIARRKRIYDYPDFDRVLAFSGRAVAELIHTLPQARRDRVSGLGIAIPFQMWDWAQMLRVSADAMASWKVRDLRAELADALAMPVYQQNDATAACSAELVFGSGDHPATVLHIFMGYFIGGGVVLNGSLFTGPSGNAGALGPLPVRDLAGRSRPLMDIASLVVLERSLDQAGVDGGMLWKSPEGWQIPEAVLEGWLAEAAPAIAQAIQSAIAVIDFEAIRIDGWMPKTLRALLVERVRACLADLDLTGLEVPRVEEGTVGADARVLGAASQPLLDRFLLGSVA